VQRDVAKRGYTETQVWRTKVPTSTDLRTCRGDLGWGLAGGIGNTVGCHPGGAMDILPLPVQRLIGPEPLTVEAIAAYVVTAVWAPSVHNTQPWWFSVAGQEISLYADFGRQLMVADPGGAR